MPRAIEAMREAFGLLDRGEVDAPVRTVIPLPALGGSFLVMAARAGDAFGAKLVTVAAENRLRGLAAVHAAVVMFDPTSGAPHALLDGESLTAIRTGAASGLATDLLARPDAARVAILGSGRQARTQLEAVCCVRKIETVSVWSQTRAHAARFAAEMVRVEGCPEEITVTASVEVAVDEADIICAATSSSQPVLLARHVGEGTHINGIGSFRKTMCEMEPELLGTARVVVDQRAAALAEAGEVIAAIERDLLTEDDLVELGAVVNGREAGRRGGAEITVFKSVGVAVQDVVAGRWMLADASGLEKTTHG